MIVMVSMRVMVILMVTVELEVIATAIVIILHA